MHRKFILFLTFILLLTVSCCISVGIKKTYISVLEKKLIYIDPGHGGMDGGATSNTNPKILEKDVTIDISYYLAFYLKRLGYRTLLTRKNSDSIEKTKKLDIYKRVDLINKSNASLYVSIHANSYPSEKVWGAQTFYTSSNINNEEIANLLMTKLRDLDMENKRVAKAISNKYLLDNVTKPGCLIEVGFLSSEKDLKNLTDEEFIKNMAFVIAIGIDEYLSKEG